MNRYDYGFLRIAAKSPMLRPGDLAGNAKAIIELIEDYANTKTDILLLPELSITGYTCGDLFRQPLFLQEAFRTLKNIAKETQAYPILTVLGLPVSFQGKVYDCAAVLHRGKIIALTPKVYLKNTDEGYERTFFNSGKRLLAQNEQIGDFDTNIPFTDTILYGDDISIGIEFGNYLSLKREYINENTPNVILNLAAELANPTKEDELNNLIIARSHRTHTVYAYASAGYTESTTDGVYCGFCALFENGECEFCDATGDVDIDKINFLQENDDSEPQKAVVNPVYEDFEKGYDDGPLFRNLPLNPYIPNDETKQDEALSRVLDIQTMALARRMQATNTEKLVLGVSGGLDSTLSILVCARVMDFLGLPRKNIIAITLPGFGTTSRTKGNAEKLSEALGCECRKIDITAACLQHFQDIGHDKNILDVTYENVQARERTQILMDIANHDHALLVGTGDLSELALGWCTYNGDHMSMYATNAGIPKTVIRQVVGCSHADGGNAVIKQVLADILNTPVSPELLPSDKTGNIAQKTEDILGPYELHDFILYHFVKYGATPKKLFYMLQHTPGKYENDVIIRTMKMFFRRFFSQQFKRSCLADAPVIFDISLSPRTGWRMPSDMSGNVWLAEIEELERLI